MLAALPIPPDVAAPLGTSAPTTDQDAAAMRATLAAAARALRRGPTAPTELRRYAEYLETMALAGAPRWFAPPGGLGWAAPEYFGLADEIIHGLDPHRGAPGDGEVGARTVMSAMTLLVSRVIEHVGDARLHPSAITPQLLVTATGAARRFRLWCPPSEPGKPAMLGVIAYAVVGAATRAIERLGDDGAVDAELCAHAEAGLVEATSVLAELCGRYGSHSAFDEGPGARRPGDASRAVRAAQGVAWGWDALGRLGVRTAADPLFELLEWIEGLWPQACAREVELGTLVASLAHLTSAWSWQLEHGAGGPRLRQPLALPHRALWLGRQAAGALGGEPAMAEGLLELAHALVVTSGTAFEHGHAHDVVLATRAAGLARSVLAGAGGVVGPATLLAAVDALARVTASVAARGASGMTTVLEALTGLTGAAAACAVARS